LIILGIDNILCGVPDRSVTRAALVRPNAGDMSMLHWEVEKGVERATALRCSKNELPIVNNNENTMNI
jgi:hypothetical protein